jgi:hypothetical protein
MRLVGRRASWILLVLAACGGSGSGGGADASADADVLPPPDAPRLSDAPDCALVTTMPSPPLTSITGHYLRVADDAEALEPVCVDSASSYLELADGQLRRYTRTYDSEAACAGAGFDTGGEVAPHDRGGLYPCGPVVEETGLGLAQQAYWKRVIDDGSNVSVFVWIGTSERGALDEVVLGSSFTTAPTDGVPSDLLRYRRPR